ncbi:MAG: hypothetical protein ACRC0G_12435 [Fusobacteriaceae bacterium]
MELIQSFKDCKRVRFEFSIPTTNLNSNHVYNYRISCLYCETSNKLILNGFSVGINKNSFKNGFKEVRDIKGDELFAGSRICNLEELRFLIVTGVKIFLEGGEDVDNVDCSDNFNMLFRVR